jgi:hypothetical protein
LASIQASWTLALTTSMSGNFISALHVLHRRKHRLPRPQPSSGPLVGCTIVHPLLTLHITT